MVEAGGEGGGGGVGGGGGALIHAHLYVCLRPCVCVGGWSGRICR